MSSVLMGSLAFGETQTDAIIGITPLIQQIEDELKHQTRSTVASVEGVASLTLLAGGKRIRPILAILSAFSVCDKCDQQRLIKLGCALEMVHMATLIHDDVIDDSKTRRGHPTAASEFGNTKAILSGDVLLARAMRMLALDGDLEIIQSVSEAVVKLAEGEVLELEARGNFDLSVGDHLQILEKKTAALISCSASVGAIVAGANAMERRAVEMYGHHLGLAFQIADDLLDFRGNKSKTGKPWATDFREGQATFPLILAKPNLSEEQCSLVKEKFGNGVTDPELLNICGLFEAHGSFEQTENFACEESSKAVQCISELRPTPYRALLEQIARFVVERES